MQQSMVSIRMDENLKKNFEYVCNELGLSVSAAITVFAKQVCRDGKIPFEITLGKSYKENLYMNQEISYDTVIFCEEESTDLAGARFTTLKEVFDFIAEESEKIFEEKNTRICFSIKISNFDSHNHIIQFDGEGLHYIRDGISTDIEYDYEQVESNDNYIYTLCEGYIRALINPIN
ncbi:MAG: type II toxin-antitoxin system RelB/DinJ family antitoxin [Clostridia bacterium]|nr:type II toxin-antitoxin system RelB/DinJ family antitoxin [Clostridia bacterium]